MLAVTPYAGSTGLLVPLVDGFGLFSPATGATLDAFGGYLIPGLVVPNPPFGIDITVQGVYLDPAALLGFRLTWARYPERL